MLSPFRMVCANFILPEPASYVFFYAFSFLRKLLYIIREMEEGELRSRGGVFFLPEGEGLPKLYTSREMEKHRAVYLPPYALRIKAEYPAARICRQCSKIVVDCK